MRKAATLVIGLALLASACTSDGDPLPDGLGGQVLAMGLQPFDQCDDLLDYLKDHALERVGPWGLDGGGYYFGDDVAILESTATTSAPATVADSAAAPVAGVDFSGTNVQELGVDEPDIVKTDGRRIFAIAQGKLHYIDATGAEPSIAGILSIGQDWGQEMLISGDTLLLVAHTYGGGPVPFETDIAFAPHGGVTTTITEVDVSDPAAMDVVRTLTLDGNYLSARLIDGVARIVVASQPVGLEFTYPQSSGLRAEREAERANRGVIERSTLENWVPYYVLRDGGSETEGTLLDCARAYHPTEFSGLGMITILTVDLADGLQPGGAIGVVADGETVYASTQSLYVATTRWQDVAALAETDGRPEAEGVTTRIHKFDITDPSASRYRASGEVPGYLLSQYSMSEHDGNLRVATTTSSDWWWGGGGDTESLVVILGEQGGELAELGRVGDLGRGERIFAVRFIGDTGYVVTFRQTDPLYTLDLSDPAAPVVTGELKIPGYSAYLHPIGDDLLLGVGQDADLDGRVQGTQVSLFDVADPANPTRLQQWTMERGSNSEVEFDARAFLHWPATGLSVIPVQRWSWDESTGAESWFAGAIGLTVDREAGLDEVGTVTHDRSDGENGWFDWATQIRRSLVIGDTLYTVSQAGLMASNLTTLDEMAWLGF